MAVDLHPPPPDESEWRAVAQRHDPARIDGAIPDPSSQNHAPRRRWLRRRGALLATLAVLALGVPITAAALTAAPSPAAPAALAAPSTSDTPRDDDGSGRAEPTPLPDPPPGVPLPDDDPDKICPPGDPLPMCNLPTAPWPSDKPGDHEGPDESGPPSSSEPPCTGEGCLPNPTSEPPGPDGKTPQPGTYEPPDECGITDPMACITEGIDALFRGIVTSALNPLLKLLGDTLLTTPTLDKLPQVGPLWDVSWHILLACYGTLVLLAGIMLMGFETFQTRYTVKEIAPRLVVGFLAGFLSLWIAEKAIRIANGLSGALLGGGLDPGSTGKVLRTMVLNAINGGGLWLLLMGLALAVMIVALLITYIIRVALTVILLIGAPMALMFHALPQTEGIARWWWRAIGAVLAIQVVQSLTLIVALKVFFDPSGFSPFGPNQTGLVNLLVALALIYVLLRTPGMLLSAAQIGGGGRTFLGSLVRGYIAYKAFGALTRRSPGPNNPNGARRGPGGPGGGPGAGLARGGPKGGPRGSGGSGSAGEPDPYARTRTTRDGQLILPMTAPRRRQPGDTSSDAAAAAKAARSARTGGAGQVPPAPQRPRQGRQMSLPLWDDWPENRPVLGRDGQYRLPIPVERVHPSTPDTPAAGFGPGARPARRGRPRGRQLELPFDPYKGIRPLRSGQYPLPLEITRAPRRTHPHGTDSGGAGAGAGGPATAGNDRPRAAQGPAGEPPRRGPGRPRLSGGQQLRLPLPKPTKAQSPRPPSATAPPPPHAARRPRANPADQPRPEGESS